MPVAQNSFLLNCASLALSHSAEFSQDNAFVKGLRWSPDGTSVLSNADDNVLRVFDLSPEALARVCAPLVPSSS